jgi:hypothetical protein
MGHTAESARQFIDEVATRRGAVGADAGRLVEVAWTAARMHGRAAMATLSATRFDPPAASR